MIAGGAAHAAASVVGADIHVLWPLRAREAVDQPLPVVLLIFFAEGGVGFPAVVAGANAVLLILRILWRQVAVVAQHLAQGGKPRGGGNMADLAAKNLPLQGDSLLGFDDFVKTYRENDPGAFAADTKPARIVASATGTPAAATGREEANAAIRAAFGK